MKNRLFAAGLAFVVVSFGSLHAAVYLDENFATFADGNLVGQNGWAQQGSINASPVSIVGGQAQLRGIPGNTADTQQNAQKDFTYNAVAGATFYYGLNLQVVGPGANNPGNASYYSFALIDQNGFMDSRLSFFNVDGETYRVSVRLNGQSSNPAGEVSQDLSFAAAETFSLVFAWTFGDGVNPDTLAVWFNPTSTDALPDIFLINGGTPVTGGFSQVLLGQDRFGSDVNVNRLAVADTFGEVLDLVAVPEPGVMGLLGLAGAACVLPVLRRGRKAFV